MSPLTIKLFGALEASVDGRQVTGIRTDKIRALLAYLAMAADRPIARHTLAGLLWPEWPEQTALGNLRKSLHRLRETVGASAPGLSELLFEISGQTVKLNAGRIALDVAQFKHLLAESQAHPHRHLYVCAPCMARLARAADFYRAELMEGFGVADAPAFEEWLLVEREALRMQALATLYDLADAHLQRGEAEAAGRYAARQIGLDLLREEAYRQHMRALVLGGEQRAAMEQYEACSRLLVRELGVEPQAETTALYERIRGADAGAAQTGQSTGAPATTAKRLALHHVPAQFTPFVGRQTELHALLELLLDPESRLITLTGWGGVGKTRLSIEAVRQMAARMGQAGHDPGTRGGVAIDEVYYFSLAGITDGELLPEALATGFELTFRAGAEPRRQLVAFLAGKRCLLVLDNFEQLAGGEALLIEILAAAPGVRMLVTSRRPLSVRAERLLALEGLACPPAAATLSDSLNYTAVQMFLQTARHILPAQSLAPDDEAAVVRICRLVEGLPLAMEIAASWLRQFDCATIAGEIERSHGFLSSAVLDVPDHHRSMETVFIRSWALLSPAEQAILARTSVFQGRFSLDALLSVTGATMAQLASLIDHSLVRRAEDGQYELHQLSRQFAARRYDELVAAGTLDEVEPRHGTYYLQLVAGHEAALHGKDPHRSGAELERALPNIRQAWDWALGHDQFAPVSRACEGLDRFLRLVGFYREGAAMFGVALARVEAVARVDAGGAGSAILGANSDILGTASDILGTASDVLGTGSKMPGADSEAHAADAIPAFDLGALRIDLLLVRSRFLMETGRAKDAYAAAETAYALAKERPDPRRRAQALDRWTSPRIHAAEFDAALRAQEEAIGIFRAINDTTELARALTKLGVVYVRMELPERGRPYVEESLRLAQASGDQDAIIRALNMMSVICSQLKRLPEALAYNRQLLPMVRAMGSQPLLSTVLGNHGFTCAQAGDDEQALACLREALQLDEALGYKEGVARHLYNMANLFERQGNHDAALAHYDRALVVLAEIGNRGFYSSVLCDRAAALLGLGRLEAARDSNHEGLAHMIETGHGEHVFQGQVLAARIEAALGHPDSAIDTLSRMLEEAKEPVQRATLHFELWRLGDGEAHAAEAVALFREEYGRHPLYDYRLRLDALHTAGVR